MRIVSRCFQMLALSAVAGIFLGAASNQGHKSSLAVRVTLLSGASRTATLEGVGCSTSMCSRVVVNSVVNSKGPDDPRVTHTWLDSLAGIGDIAKDDALFRFKDGTERRMSVVPLNRVLYVRNSSGASEKLDLGQVKALDFISPSK